MGSVGSVSRCRLVLDRVASTEEGLVFQVLKTEIRFLLLSEIIEAMNN